MIMVMDEERMRPGHWLGRVMAFCSLSVLTCMVRCPERHLAHKNPRCSNSERFSSRTDGGGGCEEKLSDPGSPRK